MWPIVRDALGGASPAIRRQLRWVIALWIAVVLGQIWDSRNATGPAGVAEFLSAVLGATGVALLGTAFTLQRTMEESHTRLRAAGHAAAVQQVLITLPALGFAAGVALGAAAALMVLRLLLGVELLLAIVALTAHVAMLAFAARTVTKSAHTLFDHAAQQAAAAAEARGQAASAQLAALQARMNPHFLFNALNTVASLVRSDPRTAEHVVENLSDVLRRTLQRSAGRMSTVEEELEYMQSYLALEQERWGPRLRVEWNVADEARARPLPPLVLQPLVENALAHGIGARLDGGMIRITIQANDDLVLRVDDDGIGFAPRWQEGTGLGNLRQRLEALYGGRARLDITSDASGAHVVVRLPCES